MSRRWFVLMSGLFVSVALITTVRGQNSKQPTSLAERMAAMRRGWSQGQPQANFGAGENSRAASEPVFDGENSAVEPRSFWPRFLNRDNGEAQTQQRGNTVPSSMTGRGMTGRNVTGRTNSARQSIQQEFVEEPVLVPRTASVPRAGSVQSSTPRANNFTLPGLGGSPLPPSEPTPTTPNSARSAASAIGGPDLSREITSENAPSRGNTRNTSTTPQARSTTVRQSPSRRTVPQVDPEQLRRELAGSFPVSSGSDQTSPRTARAELPAKSTEVNDTTTNAGETTTEAGTEKIANDKPAERTLLTLPGDEKPSVQINAATGGAPPAITPESAESTATDTPSMPSRTTGPSRNAESPFSAGAGTFLRSPRTNASAIERPTARGPEAFGEPGTSSATDEQSAGVLVSNQTPHIATEIRGPRQILVGREATYQVQLRNESDVAAEGIVANIRIPSWASVVGTDATQGMIQQSGDASGSGQLAWQLSQLDAHGSETLEIRLIPRASRPLELGVSWTLTPIGSRAIVEVQEPKLQMTVSGPDEVLFSEPQVFRLTLSNPGTGMAENVKIDLMPPGGGEKVVTSHPIGNLEPGAHKTVEVELTANEAGKLSVKAAASAEGGLTAEASKEIFCRKPELDVDWRGPETKYAGTPATYFFRVRNPGTAPAENVKVQVSLPEGAEFVSASEGQSYLASQRLVEWQVGTLGPGDDNYMELKCIVNTPGTNQFRVNAAASTGNLTATKLAQTNVVALADLELDVTDPSGPVAVGDHAVYEIRVNNRGASSAKEVNILALFSDGIEPEQVEGAMYTVTDGRVSFRTIDELQAGRELVLRIRARASKAGTHVFRAEVLCQDLEIKLAAEETTRFYADDSKSESTDATTPADSASSASDGFQAAGP